MTEAIHVDHLAIARSFAAEPYEWPIAPRFNPTGHWYIQLADTVDYQVWLHTWLPGQGTELHEHPDAGAVYVYRGELEELLETDDVGGPPRTRSLRSGFGLPLGGPHQHRITNRSALPAVSVHVFARTSSLIAAASGVTCPAGWHRGDGPRPVER